MPRRRGQIYVFSDISYGYVLVEPAEPQLRQRRVRPEHRRRPNEIELPEGGRPSVIRLKKTVGHPNLLLIAITSEGNTLIRGGVKVDARTIYSLLGANIVIHLY